MKKCIFTLMALIVFSLGANAYNYNSIGPSNTFGGNVNLIKPAPTANGSEQAYRDMVNAGYNRGYYYSGYNRPHRHKNNQSPRKQRTHGSAANKNN